MNPKPGILFVDDERKAHRYFEHAFGDSYQVMTAASVAEAWLVLEKPGNEVAVIVSDQRMPEMTGVQFFEEVQAKRPGTIRILTTAYTEIDVLVEAINQGSVFAFVPKPWDLRGFCQIVDRAVEKHRALLERQALLEKKVEELRGIVLNDQIMDVGLIAAGMGHYIYNALFPITLFLDELIEGGVGGWRETTGMEDGKSREFLGRMRDHLRGINETLRYLQRAKNPLCPAQVEEVDLVDLLGEVESSTREMRESRSIGFDSEVPEGGLTLEGEPERMRALLSLIFAEHLASLSPGKHFRVTLREAADGEGVEIVTDDDQLFLSSVDKLSLFHPFNTRSENPKDLGVFLLAVYFIVQIGGGRVESVESPMGGVRFTFRLPKRAAGGRFSGVAFSSRQADSLDPI